MLHNIYFDVDHSRIGWAKSTCNYSELMIPYLSNVSDTILHSSNTIYHRSKSLPYDQYIPCSSIFCRYFVLLLGIIICPLLGYLVMTYHSKLYHQQQQRRPRKQQVRQLQRHTSRRTVQRSLSSAIAVSSSSSSIPGSKHAIPNGTNPVYAMMMLSNPNHNTNTSTTTLVSSGVVAASGWASGGSFTAVTTTITVALEQ